MPFTIRNILFAAAVLVPAALTTHTAAAEKDITFRIANESTHRIDRLYIEDSDHAVWDGNMLLESLGPDHSLSLTFSVGRYDIKLVDSDGDACVFTGVDIQEDKVWQLTNARLEACMGNSR